MLLKCNLRLTIWGNGITHPVANLIHRGSHMKTMGIPVDNVTS